MSPRTSFRADIDLAPPDEPRAIDLGAARRAFFKTIGFGAAGAAVVGAASLGSASAQQAAINDADILNFALNLEYLEAEFYQRAAFGIGLQPGDIEGSGAQGTVSGGRQVQFSDPSTGKYAVEIANDELAHVRFLRATLGSNKVARPSIDLNLAFTFAAQEAGLIGPTQTFDAFGSDLNFLLAAFIFEDVGVTAYNGAAPLISNPTLLSGAARILAVEGYHAGAVRALLYAQGVYTATQQISDARDSLDGPTDDDQGIGNAITSNIIPSDANGLVYARTPQQVLNIVYLNPNGQRTGFFPNGLNGTLR